MKFELQVTTELIEESARRCLYKRNFDRNCPIALAVQEFLGDNNIRVGRSIFRPQEMVISNPSHDICYRGLEHLGNISEAGIAFELRFDNWVSQFIKFPQLPIEILIFPGQPLPIKFEIELFDHAIDEIDISAALAKSTNIKKIEHEKMGL